MYIVVTDPEDAFTIFNTCIQKDPFYEWAKPWLGDGLLTSRGKLHNIP